MSEKNELHFSKLGPYDASGEVNLSMYDKLPYKRNYDACNAEHIRMESGNVLKYYRINNGETYEVKNQDETFEKRIALQKRKEKEAPAIDLGNFSDDFPDRGLTDEQMSELFKDDKASSAASTENEDDDWS